MVIGCGRVGSMLATVLSSEGHDVVVIDRDSSAFVSLGSEFNGETVTGTGIDEDVLRQAGIEEADACAAVTNNDNTNIMAAQVAKHIFGVPKVVARIYDPAREETYHQLGLETVSTTHMGVTVIRNLLTTNGLRRRGTLGTGEVEMVEVKVGPGLAGKTVAEAEQAGLFRIAAVLRGGRAQVAEPGLVLAGGDAIVASAHSESLKRIMGSLGL
ncbi:MAG: potassium channel family protein [Chitinophagales bacterium]